MPWVRFSRSSSESHLDASRKHERLKAQVDETLAENKELKRLVAQSVDAFDAQSTFRRRVGDGATIRPRDDNDNDDAMTIQGISRHSTARSTALGTISSFGGMGLAFENILQQSWVYQRNQRNEIDGAMSFVSSAQRSYAWSVFSGYSLADISVLSVIAMPLTVREITNHQHYEAAASTTRLDAEGLHPVLQSSPTSGSDGICEDVVRTEGDAISSEKLEDDDVECMDRISSSPSISGLSSPTPSPQPRLSDDN